MTIECACLIQVGHKIVYLRAACALSYIQERKEKVTHVFVDNRPTDFPFRLWLLSHRKIQK